jgi:hypothetical protein
MGKQTDGLELKMLIEKAHRVIEDESIFTFSQVPIGSDRKGGPDPFLYENSAIKGSSHVDWPQELNFLNQHDHSKSASLGKLRTRRRHGNAV